MSKEELEGKYNPQEFEGELYKKWEEKGNGQRVKGSEKGSEKSLQKSSS